MADIIRPEFEDNKEDFNREVYRLILFYKQLIHLLKSFFSGYVLISEDEINRNYLRLCSRIEGILEQPGFEDLALLQWRPFENLRTLDLDDGPDIEWEYGGQQLCDNFLSAIEEIFISTGEKAYHLDMDDQQLLSQIQTYLERYCSYKEENDEIWLSKLKNQVKERWGQKQETQEKLPQFDFQFIDDEEIKNLLIKDWQEAKNAFKNGLYKSTVVLCGTVIESLLIHALSCIRTEAKSSYYQRYLEGKDKGDKSPEIEAWKMHQIIKVAKKQGIISVDAAKFSYIIKDYRNLIHLYAQKRDRLQINDYITSAVINLLAIIYNNILEWHKKRSV